MMPPVKKIFTRFLERRGMDGKLKEKKLRVGQWLTNLVNDAECADAMRAEVCFEAECVVGKREGLDSFYGANMQWFSPTLYGAYEFSYEDQLLDTSGVGHGRGHLLSLLCGHIVRELQGWVEDYESRVYTPRLELHHGEKHEIAEETLCDVTNEFRRCLAGFTSFIDLVVVTDKYLDLTTSGRGGLNCDVGVKTKFYEALRDPTSPFARFFSAFNVEVGKEKGVGFETWVKDRARPIFWLNKRAQARRDVLNERRRGFGMSSPTAVSGESMVQLGALFASQVFGSSDWDTFTPKHTDERKKREWLGSAASLLQLAVGSRSRGVCGVNEFSLPQSFEGNFTCDKQHVIHVHGITKEQRLPFKIAAAFQDQMACAEPEETIERIEREGVERKITKPFVHGFLDPYTFNTTSPPLSAIGLELPRNTIPARCLFNLLSVFREELRSYASSRVKFNAIEWREGAHGHAVVSDPRSSVFTALHKEVRDMQVSSISSAFAVCGMSADLGRSTHELRRLYVCYSYTLYGESMKELAYAQAVLGHRSLGTSAYYTKIRITKSAGGGSGVQVKRKQNPTVTFLARDDKRVKIERMSSLRGTGYNSLNSDEKHILRVGRGVDAARYMDSVGVDVTSSKLNKLGETDPVWVGRILASWGNIYE
jgi:hypothetical protein